ncbi:MAG: hypothetical protein ACRELY_20715 [Polyangiaceae bacterium]
MRTSVAGILVSGLVIATAACSVSTTGNSITFKTQTKFTYPDETRTDTAAWTGQAIKIENDGVNPNVNGDLKVLSDGTDTVSATGGIVAYADDTDKANADLTAQEAISSFTLTNDGTTITIHCGHGGDHGSSSAGKSGCLNLTVHLPVGSATQALNVTVDSGIGPVDISGPIVGSLNVNSTGVGDVNASLTPNVGSDNQIVGDSSVTVALPADFAADVVQLASQADPPAIDSSAFPDVVSGSGRGQAGTGAASIRVGTTSILDNEFAKIVQQ